MKITAWRSFLLLIRAIPERVWSPLTAGLLLLIVGLTALVAGSSWLFASLGPTAYLRARYPDSPLARLYNTFIGHLVGLASGFTAVAMFNAWDAPIVPLHELTAVRVWAAVISIILTVFVSNLLRANHPPAAATTLLVALGTFKTALDAAYVVIGVLILSVVSEGFIRLRSRALNAKRTNRDSKGGEHG